MLRRLIVNHRCLISVEKDILLLDIPEDRIHPHLIQKYMKHRLGFQNFQPFEGTVQDVLKIRKYRGAMGGIDRYFFFAIPTARLERQPDAPRYHYIYYLLNTASPISTLSLEAFNCLNEGNDDAKFPHSYNKGLMCRTGGFLVHFKPSDKVMPGVSVLGLDFLGYIQDYKLQIKQSDYSIYRLNPSTCSYSNLNFASLPTDNIQYFATTCIVYQLCSLARGRIYRAVQQPCSW